MDYIEINEKDFPKVSLEGLNSHKIAKMVDHSLLHPSMTDAEFEAECAIAKQYDVGAVCVKPYHVKRAAELMAGTDIQISAVIAFPHGNSTTEIKLAEAKTKLMAKFLGNFETKNTTMLVLPGRDETILRAAGNIEKLETSYVNTLNVYDILKAGKIILTKDALKGVEEVYA